MSKQPEVIQSMFGKIAQHYDFTNGVLSLQLHKLWNRQLTHSLTAKHTLLDLCSGTGEIAYRWLDLQKTPKTAIFLDFCEEMLEGAKAKRLPHLVKGHDLRFIQADATFLPLSSESIDGASVAYGIRNVEKPEKCFSEVFRVLKPHSKFSILELTEPENPFLNFLHTLYLRKVLPFVGGLITREKEAYSYLADSVKTFTKPEEIKDQLIKTGFKDVAIRPLTAGIATLIEASK